MHDVETQAVLLGLVASHDEAQPVPCTERLRDVPPEICALGAAGGLVHAEGLVMVCVVVLDGVRPQQIPDPLVRVLLEVRMVQWALDFPQVMHIPLAIANASVDNQDLVVDPRGQRQVRERIADHLEDRGALLRPHRLDDGLVEAVLHVHVRILVVAAVDEDLVRHGDLEGEDHHQQLDLVRAAVHHVAVEHHYGAVDRAWEAEATEEEQHITKLAVGVAENLARGLYFLQRRPRREDPRRAGDQELGDLHGPGAAAGTQEAQQRVLVEPVLVTHVHLVVVHLLHQAAGVLDDLLGGLQRNGVRIVASDGHPSRFLRGP
mmetsp:Transcript_86204/g.219592  ORF Transcript_86204/g.219592 Transcript_86204/m.219592 type:complete len:319 (+) Transcript_86204:317-1273(+)